MVYILASFLTWCTSIPHYGLSPICKPNGHLYKLLVLCSFLIKYLYYSKLHNDLMFTQHLNVLDHLNTITPNHQTNKTVIITPTFTLPFCIISIKLRLLYISKNYMISPKYLSCSFSWKAKTSSVLGNQSNTDKRRPSCKTLISLLDIKLIYI